MSISVRKTLISEFFYPQFSLNFSCHLQYFKSRKIDSILFPANDFEIEV